MGNELGNPASKLGITALAATTPNIERAQLTKLLGLLRASAAERKNDQVPRTELNAALKQLEKLGPSDLDIFVQLFTLFDEEGHDTVDYKDYLAGCASALLSDSNTDKLLFGLAIYDTLDTKCCVRVDVKRLLTSINSTAAYFGDPVLSATEVETVVVDLFNDMKTESPAGLQQEEVVKYLLMHRLVFKFMSGQGTVRFGSLELRA